MDSRLLLTFIAAAALALPAGAQSQSARNQAIRGCEDAVRQQAMEGFGTDNISFQHLNTGQNWVGGTLLDGESGQLHHFSCSVNFYNGTVRSARVAGLGTTYGQANREIYARSMDSCRAAVSDKIQDRGYFDVRINSMNVDPDGDRISGFARANGQDHPESFNFSCMLDPATGAVRGTSLIRR